MRRAGRIPNLTDNTYVLTGAEVARLYFRRGPNYIATGKIWQEHNGFPRPRNGLFLRKQVEAWVDTVFGAATESNIDRMKREMMEEAKRGTRQG